MTHTERLQMLDLGLNHARESMATSLEHVLSGLSRPECDLLLKLLEKVRPLCTELPSTFDLVERAMWLINARRAVYVLTERREVAELKYLFEMEPGAAKKPFPLQDDLRHTEGVAADRGARDNPARRRASPQKSHRRQKPKH